MRRRWHTVLLGDPRRGASRRVVVARRREPRRCRRAGGKADRASRVDRGLGRRRVELEQRVERCTGAVGDAQPVVAGFSGVLVGAVGRRAELLGDRRRIVGVVGFVSLVRPVIGRLGGDDLTAAATVGVGREIGISRRGDDDDIATRRLRHRRGGEGRGRLFVDGAQRVATAVIAAEGAEQRYGEHDGEGHGADAEHARVDRAERTEPVDERCHRLDPHRRAVVELVERDLAAHDVMSSRPFGRPPANSLDLRGAVRIFGRTVPEVVVVEVVAHHVVSSTLAWRDRAPV